MNELLNEIESTDQAFVSAMTPKSFDGVQLQPYSLMRQMVAMELTGLDSSAMFEAIIHVWVCTLDPKAAIAALSDKGQAKLEAFAWAEAHGVSLRNLRPIIALYRRLNEEIDQSTLARVQDNGTAPKNDGRLPE